MKKPSLRTLGTVLGSMAIGALVVPVAVSANSRTNLGNHTNDAIAARTFTAVLSGAAELAGGATSADPDGAGAVTVTVDQDARQVCIDAAALNIDSIVADHIHKGPVTGSGGPIIDFGGELNKCVTVAATTPPTVDPIVDIVANPADYYFNIHTTAYGSGAIRGQLAVHANSAGSLHMLPEPLRAFDSREGTTPTKVKADETRTVNLWFGKDGAGATKLAVPPGATGALITVTVTDTETAGFLKVYSGALATAPATSAINWSATNENLAVSTSVAVSSTSDIKITGGSHSTNVVVDVVGYYF